MNTLNDTKTVALIVAAGRGRRFGGAQPKQYAPLGGRTVLAWTVDAFMNHPGVDGVRCVIHPDDQDLYAAAVFDIGAGKPGLLPPVFGGATRQDSVRLGLESLVEDGVGRILIHDAARPFVDAGVIDGVLKALETHPGALPALAVTDTLKRGTDGRVEGTAPRDGLFRAQTPQGFAFEAILQAHKALAGRELTDDAQLLEHLGQDVALSPGAENNFKITTEEDLMRAQTLLSAARITRTGSGYDVHKFGPGDHVTLCGVDVPHDRGLVGHSDADVALHALTDALLGAIGAGDIGVHFPPSDPQWKGASSDRFAAHAAELVRAQGGEIVNVDVTVICEAPKLTPHKDAMAARVAEILSLPRERVSVKATTTEGLGAMGRGEGIAATAVANVSALP